MAKPDPALLDPARYPFVTEADVRFGDIDVNRHINNVSIASFVEEGRVRFHRASGFFDDVAGRGAMVASLSIEFIGEGHFPGSIFVHVGATRLGTSSYDLALLLLQDGRPIATAASVLVSTRHGKPCAIAASTRNAMADWMVRP